MLEYNLVENKEPLWHLILHLCCKIMHNKQLNFHLNHMSSVKKQNWTVTYTHCNMIKNIDFIF